MQLMDFLKRHALRLGILFIFLALLVGYFIVHARASVDTRPTATVMRGSIEELVSISGTVRFIQDAKLSFPVSGTISVIPVTEGSVVGAGAVLATLEQQKLQADKKDAEAALAIAQANRDELESGPSKEARDVTDTTVHSAESALLKTTSEQDAMVENAQRTLFSDHIVAVPERKENAHTPPTITGSYTCSDTGQYNVDIYPSSGADSGYSYTLAGLETSGASNAYTQSPQPLGTCGLFIQFSQGTIYSAERWIIDIPNKRSVNYITNQNAYTLALKKRDTAIASARDALESARRAALNANATPRSEARVRADAAIAQAEARLAAIEADIADRTLRAPFAGTVTSIPMLPGETSEQKAITLVSNNAFELVVRIPEIDITKVTLGETARAVFDAKSDETLTAKVTFISPLATLIDGVSYYEAHLTLDAVPSWMRGGLNADVDIIADSHDNVLRLPLRFITNKDGKPAVAVHNGNSTELRPIDVGFKSGDGYAEVKKINEGQVVILP